MKAPFADEARQVAVRFVQTAVARKNLDEAWELVGPEAFVEGCHARSG